MSVANPYRYGIENEAGGDMKLRRSASFASLAVAATLIAAKLVAYIVTDSVSLMTSLMDSVFDLTASTVMLFSIIHAATPADEEHRFGHGKIEALAAMGQALFILGSAGYLFAESLHRFIHPETVKAPLVGIGVMVLSILLTGVLIAYQNHVIRQTASVGISADNVHYKGDLLMNFSVLVALLLSYYSDWPYFDPLFAAVISLVLIYSAWAISRESFDILIDRELPDEDRKKIEALVRAHPATQDIHDLRTRHSGQHIFIEFHIEMDGDMSLAKAHDVTEELEMAIYREFPKAEVLIHPEPEGLDDHHKLDDNLKN